MYSQMTSELDELQFETYGSGDVTFLNPVYPRLLSGDRIFMHDQGLLVMIVLQDVTYNAQTTNIAKLYLGKPTLEV